MGIYKKIVVPDSSVNFINMSASIIYVSESMYGTASYATQASNSLFSDLATTASFCVTSSYIDGGTF